MHDRLPRHAQGQEREREGRCPTCTGSGKSAGSAYAQGALPRHHVTYMNAAPAYRDIYIYIQPCDLTRLCIYVYTYVYIYIHVYFKENTYVYIYIISGCAGTWTYRHMDL